MTRIHLARYKQLSKELRKEETEVEAHGDEDVFPSSSLVKEYVSLEGCEIHHTGLLNATKASPYSPMNSATKA